jgi:hypothetical protein
MRHITYVVKNHRTGDTFVTGDGMAALENLRNRLTDAGYPAFGDWWLSVKTDVIDGTIVDAEYPTFYGYIGISAVSA